MHYVVTFKGLSDLHTSLIKESDLMAVSKRKLQCFNKRKEDEEVDEISGDGI